MFLKTTAILMMAMFLPGTTSVEVEWESVIDPQDGNRKIWTYEVTNNTGKEVKDFHLEPPSGTTLDFSAAINVPTGWSSEEDSADGGMHFWYTGPSGSTLANGSSMTFTLRAPANSSVVTINSVLTTDGKKRLPDDPTARQVPGVARVKAPGS